MEASGVTTEVGTAASEAGRTNRAGAFVREVGDVAGFSARAVFELRGVSRFAAEILRQSGILIVGMVLIAVVVAVVAGANAGLFLSHTLGTIGAESLSGAGSAFAGLRELYVLMFSYIFAAKVGCGLVAEIGSMRINEELDGLEAVGIDPMRYVVGTRLVATLLCVPLIYVVVSALGALGSYLVIVVQLDASSAGAWEGYWLIQTAIADNVLPLLKAVVIAMAIVLVGTYYGYRARGGPVGVGAATARSMIVNIVLIHAINATMTALFYRGDPQVPFGG